MFHKHTRNKLCFYAFLDELSDERPSELNMLRFLNLKSSISVIPTLKPLRFMRQVFSIVSRPLSDPHETSSIYIMPPEAISVAYFTSFSCQ
jgi:hypothetical protein